MKDTLYACAAVIDELVITETEFDPETISELQKVSKLIFEIFSMFFQHKNNLCTNSYSFLTLDIAWKRKLMEIKIGHELDNLKRIFKNTLSIATNQAKVQNDPCRASVILASVMSTISVSKGLLPRKIKRVNLYELKIPEQFQALKINESENMDIADHCVSTSSKPNPTNSVSVPLNSTETSNGKSYLFSRIQDKKSLNKKTTSSSINKLAQVSKESHAIQRNKECAYCHALGHHINVCKRLEDKICGYCNGRRHTEQYCRKLKNDIKRGVYSA